MAANTIASIMGRLVVQETGCCLWPGSKDRGGHGRVGYQGKEHYVHRLLYETFVGKVPEGCVLDHMCNTPSCGNFTHVEPKTPPEHMRRHAGSFCPHGHERTPENVRRQSKGKICRRCEALRMRSYRALTGHLVYKTHYLHDGARVNCNHLPGWETEDRGKVDCVRCKKTKAYRLSDSATRTR